MLLLVVVVVVVGFYGCNNDDDDADLGGDDDECLLKEICQSAIVFLSHDRNHFEEQIYFACSTLSGDTPFYITAVVNATFQLAQFSTVIICKPQEENKGPSSKKKKKIVNENLFINQRTDLVTHTHRVQSSSFSSYSICDNEVPLRQFLPNNCFFGKHTL